MFGRNKVAMLMAEFLGTATLTLVVLSVQRSTIGIAYFVALAAGLTIAAMSFIFTNVSGAHFNPAITVGAFLARKVKLLPALSYIVAQFLGAWAAYGLYIYFVNSSLPQISSHFSGRIMVAEAIGVFIFAFVWAAVAAQKLAASLVGAGFTLGVIVASSASIGFLNPAIAMGARAFNVWPWMTPHWLGWGTYFAGPLLGSVVAFLLYEFVFSESGLNFASYAGFGAVAPSATVARPVASASKVTRVTAPKTGRATVKKTLAKRR